MSVFHHEVVEVLNSMKQHGCKMRQWRKIVERSRVSLEASRCLARGSVLLRWLRLKTPIIEYVNRGRRYDEGVDG